MKELLEYLLKNIFASDEVKVEEVTEGNRVEYIVSAPKEMIGLIIGKEGKTIKALRNVLKVKATLEQKGVNISIKEV